MTDREYRAARDRGIAQRERRITQLSVVLNRTAHNSRREFIALKNDRLPQRRVSPVALSAMVRLGMVACPDWLIKARQLEADADDENKTRQALREAMQ